MLNRELAEELHITVIRKYEKRKVNPRYFDNI